MTTRRRQKVLVVDDDPGVCELVKKLLQEHGYEVLEAHRGDAAIAKVQAAHPDLLVLDVLLSGGLDGVQVYHRLKGKSSTRRIPVIFLTGTVPSGSATTQQLPLGERCAVIGKPFNVQVLLQEIQRLLGTTGELSTRSP
ncbi:MAG: response regulator [Candidatus Omnitrophica bacterium]|nr:response regulator [Candidatus Omnitrophota bacterium]